MTNKKQHERSGVTSDVPDLPVIRTIENVLCDFGLADCITPLRQVITEQEIPVQLSYEDTIAKLATLKPYEYDRVRREQAKKLVVQMDTLDTDVKAARHISNEDNNASFIDIAPHPEPIDPAQLLDQVSSAIQKFIVMDKYQANTAALWLGACWFVDVIPCSPIALINAPEKACGKTQLLTVLGKLAPRAAEASGISSSVLFRMVEAYKPTLFIDEIETVLKDNDDLRGLINAGHTRDSSFVWRSVVKGKDFEPKRFNVWGMKAISGINAVRLAGTVTSRSIIFELRRKKPDEKVERLRNAEPGLFSVLASKFARFANDYKTQVQDARPSLPDHLDGRDQDNWEPLLSIAHVASGHWPKTALDAALRLSGATQIAQSSSNELLADIQYIFKSKNLDKISTAELISALTEDEEKAWATYNKGKPISAKQIANKLTGYGIHSKTIRTNAYETPKGFELSQFSDVFVRYLSTTPVLPQHLQPTQKANKF